MKKILITGGAGFIGSNLARKLLLAGNDVYIIDNLSTGSFKNIEDLKTVKFSKIDIRDKMCILTEAKFDEIYHLACPASPVQYQKSPVNTIDTCVTGSMVALELARKQGAKILLASTSEVYGDPVEHPQTESYWGNVNPVGKRACYDEGKRCSEALFFSYNLEYGVNIRIARIFNTYGPGMEINDGRVISNFICQALQNQPITIYGTGQQTRSFCYVSDTVRALIDLMKSEVKTPVNIGNPNEKTIIEIAETVKTVTGKNNLMMVFEALPQDDPCRRKPDISKAEGVLKWRPEINLVDGLFETVEYFRTKLKIAGETNA